MSRLFYILMIFIFVSCGNDNKSRPASGGGGYGGDDAKSPYIIVDKDGVREADVEEDEDDEDEDDDKKKKKPKKKSKKSDDDEDDEDEDEDDDDDKKDTAKTGDACQDFFLAELASDPIATDCAACHGTAVASSFIELTDDDDANFEAIKDAGFASVAAKIADGTTASHTRFVDDWEDTFAEFAETCK